MFCCCEVNLWQPDDRKVGVRKVDLLPSWITKDTGRIVRNKLLDGSFWDPEVHGVELSFMRVLLLSLNVGPVATPHLQKDGLERVVEVCVCLLAVRPTSRSTAEAKRWKVVQEIFDRRSDEVFPASAVLVPIDEELDDGGLNRAWC